MIALFDYLIKSALSITILYIVFHLFFKNRVSFLFNRILLLSIVSFGLLVPILSFNIANLLNFNSPYVSTIIDNEGLITINLREVVISSEAKSGFLGMNLFLILARLYLSVSLILTMWFAIKIVRLVILFRKSKSVSIDGIRFVILNNDYPTFSFFNMVFISKNLYENKDESRKIIEHESVHLLQKHSIDLLFTELLVIIQWFNPIAYLIRDSIRENHEFLADKGILNNGFNIPDYKLLLLRNSTKIRTGSFTHNFSYSLIKKRFKMMEKKDSKIKFILGMMILPLAFSLAFFACSSPELDDSVPINTEEPVVETQTNEEPQTVTEAPIFTVVEEMPEFIGGTDELYKFLGSNIKYPEKAKADGIHGKVYVNFIVEKDGKVTNVNVLRGIGGGCDEESVRVLNSMPNWIPGKQRGENVRVSYNLPIKFALQ